MQELLKEIAACTICQAFLALGPRPILAATENSRIVIVGQAPGKVVHESGVPWQDKSGDRLRLWLGVSKDQFYNPDQFALLPMGFCYPGKGKSGDLPPRTECAPQWHNLLFSKMKNLHRVLRRLAAFYESFCLLQVRFFQLIEGKRPESGIVYIG